MRGPILCVIFLVILSAGCGTHRSSHPPRLGQTERAERSASNALVDEGEKYLNGGSYDRAGDSFREAIRVDPTNGAAYYWLATVKFRSGEYGEVWGLIEKAESLLRGDPAWARKVEELKREIQATKPD